MRKTSVTKICSSCGKNYDVKAYRSDRSRFCTLKCRGSLTGEQKFTSVGWDVVSECWVWRGRLDAGGYGYFNLSGKAIKAHRFSWEMSKGPIPAGILVLHRCDNRPCIRPEHLFLGTDADNVADMDQKGRRYVLRGEKNGHSKLSESDVLKIAYSPAGYGTGRALAAAYHVSPSTISLIRLGKVWKHVR